MVKSAKGLDTDDFPVIFLTSERWTSLWKNQPDEEGVLLHCQVKIKYYKQYLKHWKLLTLVLDEFKTPKAVSAVWAICHINTIAWNSSIWSNKFY